MRRVRHLAPPLLATIAMLCAGCGVAFTQAKDERAFFDSLTITGQGIAGAPLTAALAYRTNYPLAVEVTCELRQGKRTLSVLGSETVPAVPGGAPKATPLPGNFSFDFTVDAPGSYKVQCYTPADEDNFIEKPFTVRS
jgi:hypothetical protein